MMRTSESDHQDGEELVVGSSATLSSVDATLKIAVGAPSDKV
jgi:hypothetical protein